MKTINKIIILFVIIITGLSACGDWLDLQPEDGVIRDRFWKTKEEAFSALMGCYASLMEPVTMQRIFVWGELRADMVEPTAIANADLIAIQNGEIVSTNAFTRWEDIYRTINQCNTVIELSKYAQEKDMSFSDGLLKQYEAEAVCIRSLAYFYLVRTFRDVPYITQASIYDDQKFSVPASKQADIVDSLIMDLRKVENDVAYSHNTLAANKGRFNTMSLKTLLADIYLWKEDYDNTIDLCTQIIGSGQYSLIPVGREEVLIDGIAPGTQDTVFYVNEGDVSRFFNQMYVVGNSVESIFELQFGVDKENGLAFLLLPGSTALQPKMENFSDEYFLSSQKDRGWFDMRGEGVSYKQGYVWKWIGLSKDEFLYRQSGTLNNNWIFYRLADVILMKAEALTQKARMNGDDQAILQEALDLVTQIRERANATESTDMFLGHTGDLSGKSMEEFVLNERVRELTFEGKRWYDVLRHAKRNNYATENLNYLMNLAVLAAPPEKSYSLQKKWMNPGSHYFPIYKGEVGAGNEGGTNKELEQNEFYKD